MFGVLLQHGWYILYGTFVKKNVILMKQSLLRHNDAECVVCSSFLTTTFVDFVVAVVVIVRNKNFASNSDHFER